MKTWPELEADFRELQQAFQFARVDGQWGAAGEYWRIAGTVERAARDRFEVLSRMAGQRLLELTDGVLSEGVLGEPDPVVRWYKFVGHQGSYLEFGLAGQQIMHDGSDGGFIYTGHINRPADASAVMCLQLQTAGAKPVVPIAPVPPPEMIPPALGARLNRWLDREAHARGRLWLVVGSVIGLVLGALALLH